MELEKVAGLISESAGRLVKAAEESRRDEKWWAALAREDWNLIQLSWQLRGIILRRRKNREAAAELDAKARKQIEEILKRTTKS